jgi:hypothetical protein
LKYESLVEQSRKSLRQIVNISNGEFNSEFFPTPADSVSDTGNKTLQEADFSGDYGVLKFSLSQFNAIPSSDISPAIQKALALGIKSQIDDYIGLRERRTGEGVVPRISYIPDILSSSFDISNIKQANAGGITLADIYPDLNDVSTVRDAFHLLFRADKEGFGAQIKRLGYWNQDSGGKNSGSGDMLSETMLGFMGAVSEYNGASEFALYAQRYVYNHLRKVTREQTSDGKTTVGIPDNDEYIKGQKDNFTAPLPLTNQQIQNLESPLVSTNLQENSPGEIAGMRIGMNLDFFGKDDEEFENDLALLQSGQTVTFYDTDGNPYPVTLGMGSTVPVYNPVEVFAEEKEKKSGFAKTRTNIDHPSAIEEFDMLKNAEDRSVPPASIGLPKPILRENVLREGVKAYREERFGEYRSMIPNTPPQVVKPNLGPYGAVPDEPGISDTRNFGTFESLSDRSDILPGEPARVALPYDTGGSANYYTHQKRTEAIAYSARAHQARRSEETAARMSSYTRDHISSGLALQQAAHSYNTQFSPGQAVSPAEELLDQRQAIKDQRFDNFALGVLNSEPNITVADPVADVVPYSETQESDYGAEGVFVDQTNYQGRAAGMHYKVGKNRKLIATPMNENIGTVMLNSGLMDTREDSPEVWDYAGATRGTMLIPSNTRSLHPDLLDRHVDMDGPNGLENEWIGYRTALRNGGNAIGHRATNKLLRSPNASKAYTSFMFGSRRYRDITNPPLDPVIADREISDLRKYADDEEKVPEIGDNVVQANQDDKYIDAISVLPGDIDNPANNVGPARIALMGAADGWGGMITDYMTTPERVASDRDFKALKAAGVLNATVANQIGTGDPNLIMNDDDGYGNEVLPPEDDEHPVTVNTPKPKAVQRHRGSDVGNLPNVRGGHGRATPEARRRHSADGDFIEPDMPNITGNSARNANPTGRTERNPLYTYDHASDEDIERIKTQASHYIDYRAEGRNYAFSFYYPEGDEVTKNHVFAAANTVFREAGIPFGDIDEFTSDDGYKGVRFNLPEGVRPTNRARTASDEAEQVPGNESQAPDDTSDNPFAPGWDNGDPTTQSSDNTPGAQRASAGGGRGNSGGGGRPPRRSANGTGGNGGGSSGGNNGGSDNTPPSDGSGPSFRRRGTPTPNRLIQEGLRMGSRRTSGYNPSVNPLASASRVFGRRITQDYEEWEEETRWDPAEFTSETNELFQNYLSAASEGIGDEFIQANVPENLRKSFRKAARVGTISYEGAVKFAKAASPTGVAEYFAKAQGETLGAIGGYSNALYGDIAQRDVFDDNGTVIGQRRVIQKNGQETLGTKGIDEAERIAQSALSEVTGSALPSEPGSMAATIRSRVNGLINRHIDDIEKSMRDNGASETEVQQQSGRIRSVATHATDTWLKQNSGDLHGAERAGSPGADDQGDINHEKRRVVDKADAEELMRNSPNLAGQVGRYMSSSGKTLDDMIGASDEDQTVFEDGNMSLSFGGRGTPRGGYDNNRNPKLNMWKGKIGTAMYAAYIGTRMWNMGMGEEVQAATKYGDYASGIGNMVGGGTGMLGTDSGFAARQSIGQLYEGRGAYQEFGSFMDASFYMSAGGSEAGSRMWASAKAGATTAAEISIGGSLLQTLPGVKEGDAISNAAKSLPVAGAVIGGLMAAGTGLMEIWNGAHPNDDPVTWGSMFKGTVDNNWRLSARSQYFKNNPGQTEWFTLGGVDILKPGASEPTKEQLRPYLTDAQFGSMFPEKNADVEAAIKASSKFLLFGMDDAGAKAATQLLFQTSGIVPTEDEIMKYGPNVQRFGNSAITDPGQYAHNLGFTPGTAQFQATMDQFNEITDVAGRDNGMQYSSRYAQVAAQQSPYMIPTEWGVSNQIAQKYGINTQPKASSWQRFNQTVSNYQANAITSAQMNNTGLFTMNITPRQADFIAQMGDLAGEAGVDVMGAMGAAWSANLSPRQMDAASTVMSGDLQGSSYFANQGMLSSKYGLYNASGNPISETNGAAAMVSLAQWSTSPSWITGANSTFDAAARFTGNNGNDITRAFLDNGMRGIQDLSIKSSRDAQIASAGIQMAGIAQQRTYLWGSGSWSDPSANSAWGLQDQQVSMQYGFQQADFNYSQRSMDLSFKYSGQSEANQQQRMNTSQSYNLWQMDFSHMQSLQQRNWTQQDYQYQDTQREENFDWQMTDINEDIRFAGGRQRRQLIRQRDRAALTHSQDEEQIDTTRGRQTELWAQEDERYAKQKAYTLELNGLDKQSFDTNRQQRLEVYAMETENLARKRKEFDETQALEKQARDLERDNQAKSLALQAASAGLQAKQAEDQYRYSQATLEADRNWTDMLGKIQNSAKYDAVNKFWDSMAGMVDTLNSADTNKINQIIYLIQQLTGG